MIIKKGIKGIDISVWQPAFTDYESFKNAGYGYLICKISEGQSTDKCFEQHYNNCIKNNVPVGVYVFSHATNSSKAITEANYALKVLAGRKLNLPIFIDLEASDINYGWNVDITPVALSFGETIKKAGYKWGVYANQSWMLNKLNVDTLRSAGAMIWCAKYSSEKPTVYCDIWQYADNGRVPGFSGNLDMNVTMNEIDTLKTEISSITTPTVDVDNYPLIRRGSRGTYVKKCQELLMAKGYELPLYGADGDFGAEMYSAVIKFQRDHGLEVDGIVGTKTWEALLAAEDVKEEDTKTEIETKPDNNPSGGGVTTKYDKQKVINIALAEVGYLEKRTNSQLDDKTANAGYNNWNKYARDIDEKYPTFYNGKKNGFAWCDIFVDWCFIQAYGVDGAKKLLGQPNYSAGAGCQYSANYYRKMGRFYTSPQVGDQVFFGSYGNEGHTGLVVAVNGDIITTVEGNTSGSSGVVSNGGGVFKKQYNIKTQYIPGYGRPNYSDGSNDTISIPTPALPSGSDIKSNIKAFQTWLNINYKTGISADGIYGPLTKKAAIKAFQSYANTTYKAGLVVDGDFGPKSKAAAQKCIISQGMKGAGVYIVQGLLYCNNINAGGFDGDFGSGMDSAVKSYQSRNGLPADGIIGLNTWSVFFR